MFAAILFLSNAVVDGKKNVVISIYSQKILSVKKTLMEGTQTRTTAASLFAVPVASLNEGFVLLV